MEDIKRNTEVQLHTVKRGASIGKLTGIHMLNAMGSILKKIKVPFIFYFNLNKQKFNFNML